MIYDYYCQHCDTSQDVIKAVKDIDRKERCEGCARTMVRQFAFGGQVSPDRFEAHYNPAFGRVLKNRKDLRESQAELLGEKGVDAVEVGNSKHTTKPPHKSYEWWD